MDLFFKIVDLFFKIVDLFFKIVDVFFKIVDPFFKTVDLFFKIVDLLFERVFHPPLLNPSGYGHACEHGQLRKFQQYSAKHSLLVTTSVRGRSRRDQPTCSFSEVPSTGCGFHNQCTAILHRIML